MTPRLRDFQNAFAEALANADTEASHGALAELVAQPGFAVYRNTVMRGCIDALQANYPAVTRLVGEPWFRAAAAVFVRRHPPDKPSLVAYGEGFPEFLEEFPPAAELPYLSGVARLDRFWTEAHVAADDTRLQAAEIGSLDGEERTRARLRLHASARWRAFPELPIYSIWRGNRGEASAKELTDLVWRGEGALLARPEGSVDAVRIDAAECAFLDACGRGSRLGEAGLAALAADAEQDLSALLARLLGAGAFAAIEFLNDDEEE